MNNCASSGKPRRQQFFHFCWRPRKYAEKAIPQTTIPLLTGKTRLLIDLDHYDYANYQVILQTVEGREILRRRTDKVRFGKYRAFATLPVKAEELTKGDYILILFGQTSDGKIEEIDRYPFRVS